MFDLHFTLLAAASFLDLGELATRGHRGASLDAQAY